MPCQLYHMGLVLGYKELKSCISFNFSIFLYNSHDLPQKKLHAFTAKKNYTTRRFFCTRLAFFTYGADPRL